MEGVAVRYEAPELTVIGTVRELTEALKPLGVGDGVGFSNQQIVSTSTGI